MLKHGISEASQSIRNQHYIRADAANANFSFLYNSFISTPNNLNIYGSFWFWYPSGLAAAQRILLLSFGEAITVGTWAQGVAFTPKTVDTTANFVLGEGAITSTGDASISVAQTTPDIAMTPNKWYHVKFLYNSSNPSLSVFELNGVSHQPTTLVGSSTTVRNYTICRLMQYKIPLGLRMAQIWMHCGDMTPGDFATLDFGKEAPYYCGMVGDYVRGLPPLVYVHCQKMAVENVFNQTDFIVQGTAFTSVIQATDEADFVITS